MELDYSKLFFSAINTMIDNNGGSLQTALSDIGIEWDSEEGKEIRKAYDWEDEYMDEDDLNLPKELEIARPDINDLDEMNEYISNYLSDEYGFCVKSFNFEFDMSKVYITEIDWDTED